MLERMARHVVEQIELAGDLDASEGECTEHKASRERRHSVEGEQHAAGGERQRAEGEHEAPPDQPHQERDAEPSGDRDEPGSDIEQRHRPRGAEQVQRLQRNDREQDRLRHARNEEQAQKRQCLAARQSADRSWNGGPRRAPDCGGVLGGTGLQFLELRFDLIEQPRCGCTGCRSAPPVPINAGAAPTARPQAPP